MEHDAILKDVLVTQANGRFFAIGKIFSDSKLRFGDAEVVRTSYINSIDFENGIIQTRNTVYKIEGGMSLA